MGLEHTSKSPEETHFPEEGGAESGALASTDPQLALLIEAWRTLPGHVKDVIVAIVKGQ